MAFPLFQEDLIETLWNVKFIVGYVAQCVVCDLIETLWNVKNTTAEDHGWLVSRFNRDIVECKVIDTYQSTVDEIDLIETLWNVKSKLKSIYSSSNIDLIETLWNVKVRKVWDTVRRFLI